MSKAPCIILDVGHEIPPNYVSWIWFYLDQTWQQELPPLCHQLQQPVPQLALFIKSDLFNILFKGPYHWHHSVLPRNQKNVTCNKGVPIKCDFTLPMLCLNYFLPNAIWSYQRYLNLTITSIHHPRKQYMKKDNKLFQTEDIYWITLITGLNSNRQNHTSP